MDLFMINITRNTFYVSFIFSAYCSFKIIYIIFAPGLCSWRYHSCCLAGTQPLVYSVHCFLSCTFYVVIKKKKFQCSRFIGQCILVLRYCMQPVIIPFIIRTKWLSQFWHKICWIMIFCQAIVKSYRYMLAWIKFLSSLKK